MGVEVNDREATALMQRLIAVGANPQPWLAAIGNAVADNTRLRFSESKAPDGSTWAPLSPVTVARRRQHSDRPLLDTGLLRNSISSRADDRGVTIGTNKVQAAMLHFGAKRGQFGRGRYRTRRGSFPIPWGDVPARPIFGISSEDRTQMLDILRGAMAGEK